MSIKTDLVLVYQMGYADALGRRKPEPSKVEDMADSIASENARLREQIEVFFDAMHKSATATRKLQAENDKLRKLCELAFTCIEQGEDEYGTDWSCAGCEFCDKCDGLIQARATAQELGIEV